ncbi:MAG: hypothetical protein JW888_07595 [Pirellulales bacterium]|nr:hypothetical protein [Pirellulales bacterium]
MGFLTVLECPRDGLFGGYLALTFLGRPLEFRCTAPIKPNRAQQILYGSTLDPYLYGEQIGKTLLSGATISPLVVFTDQSAILAAGDCVDVPVVLVQTPTSEKEAQDTAGNQAEIPSSGSNGKTWRVHAAHAPDFNLAHFRVGRNHLATIARTENEQATITERLAGLTESFDLAEPFTRIREAIEEARGGGGS